MSGSLRDLLKSLNTLFSSSHPDIETNRECRAVIESYVERHTPSSETDRARLHEELLSLYHRHVNGPKNPSFLHVLCLLKHELILEPEHCGEWWDLMLYPLLRHSENLKRTLQDSSDICMDTLVFHEDDVQFKTRHAAAQVLKSKIFSAYFTSVNSRSRLVSSNLELLLLTFAKRRTQDFFDSIDEYINEPIHRLQSLTLLSMFIRFQTQYIYQIYNTALLRSILLCLQHDASTTVVSLALTVFIMILPHIPDKIASMLPMCFRIFARLLCWDRLEVVQRRTAALIRLDGQGHEGGDHRETPDKNETQSEGWIRLDASFDTAQSTPIKCSQFFTFLYGLYPNNFLAFLRSPSLVLNSSVLSKSGDESLEDDLDPELIRSRAQTLLKRHLVHPSMTSLTAETELSDTRRWMQMEPSDVVMMCLALDTIDIGSQSHTRHKERTIPEQDIIPLDLTFEKLQRSKSGDNSYGQMTAEKVKDGLSHSVADRAGDVSCLASPAFSPVDVQVKPNLETKSHMEDGPFSSIDTLQVHEAIHALFPARGVNGESLRMPDPADLKSVASEYERQILLLKNELNYERYLKQQHLQHIGRLQRSQVQDVAVETERQNLYNTTRALKAKVANLEKTLRGLRTEVATTKTNRAQYEASLNDRIKRLREEKTVLANDQESLQNALAQARADVVSMRISLGVSEGLALNLKQQLEVLRPEIQETKDLKKNFDLLKQRIRDAEVQDIQLRMEKERVSTAQVEAKASSLRLLALQQEIEAARSQHTSLSSTGESFEFAAPLTQSTTNTVDAMLKLQAERLQVSQAEAFLQLKVEKEKARRLTTKIHDLEAEVQSLRVSAEHAANLVSARRDSTLTPIVGSDRIRPLSISTRSASIGARPDTIDRRASTSSSISSSLYQTAAHGSRRTDALQLTNVKPTSQLSSALSSPGEQSIRAQISPATTPSQTSIKKENKSLGGRFRW